MQLGDFEGRSDTSGVDFFFQMVYCQEVNDTIVVLIPKKEDPVDPKDYRPISFVM
jgi:hypothetical protein